MNIGRKVCALVCLAVFEVCSADVAVEVFAPGVVSGPGHDAAPAFTPDGGTVYFQRSSVAGGTILVSKRQRDGRWSEPQIAPFSGVWSDIEPAMAPDGSFLVFISNRPTHAGGAPLMGFYNGSESEGGNMWRVDRRGDGWSEAVRLPDTVNTSPVTFSPSVVADGSVYFMTTFGERKKFRLYRSQYRNGQYLPAEPLPFSVGEVNDVDPAVAPDESFMVFGSGRAPAKSMDLFYVRREKGTWGAPIYLAGINSPGSDAEPRLSPDSKTLYFSSERVVPVKLPRSLEQARIDLRRLAQWDTGLYNIWSVPLAAAVKAAAPAN